MTNLLTNFKPNIFLILEIDFVLILTAIQDNLIYIFVTVGIRLIEYLYKRKKKK